MADAPLDTYLGGRYGTPHQGVVAPDWARNPAIPVVGGSATLPGTLDVNLVSPNPLPVQVENDCTAPVMTQDCGPSMIAPVETAMAQLGIIKDPVTGEPIGRVMVSRVTDELTGAVTETISAYYEDGSAVSPYTGPWFIEGDCTVSAPEGVLPAWG